MMLWMSPWKKLSQKRKLMLKTLPKNGKRQPIVEESTRSSDQIYLAILWRMSLLNYLFGCPPEVATSWVMDVDWIMIFIHVLQQEWLKYAADFPDFTPRTINTSTFMVDIPPSGFGRHTDGLCGDWVFLSKFTIAMSLKKKIKNWASSPRNVQQKKTGAYLRRHPLPLCSINCLGVPVLFFSATSQFTPTSREERRGILTARRRSRSLEGLGIHSPQQRRGASRLMESNLTLLWEWKCCVT